MRVLTLGDSSRCCLRAPESLTQLAQPLGPTCQDAVPPHYPLPHPTQPGRPASASLSPPREAGQLWLSAPTAATGSPQGGWVPGWWAEQPLPEAAGRSDTLYAPVGLDTYATPPLLQHLRQASSWSHLSPHAAHWTLPPNAGLPLCPGGPLSMEHPQGLRTPPSQNNVQALLCLAFQRACQPLPASQPCSGAHEACRKARRKPRRRCGYPAAEGASPSRSRRPSPAPRPGPSTPGHPLSSEIVQFRAHPTAAPTLCPGAPVSATE